MDKVLNNFANENESNDNATVVSDSEIQDKKTKTVVKTVVKTVDTNKVLEYFKESIDYKKSYTLDEYKKLITTAYKEAAKKTSKKSNKSGKGTGTEVVKREPTKYNIFVKEEILKLKTENPEKQYKDLMKMAADRWNENKLTA